MLNVNWKVRAKNKYFWLALVPALILLIQTVAAIFGFELDLEELQGEILAALNALFAVLVIIGVVNDPTTNGVSDSERAKSYEEPYSE